jgi:hypothetical protein
MGVGKGVQEFKEYEEFEEFRSREVSKVWKLRSEVAWADSDPFALREGRARSAFLNSCNSLNSFILVPVSFL